MATRLVHVHKPTTKECAPLASIMPNFHMKPYRNVSRLHASCSKVTNTIIHTGVVVLLWKTFSNFPQLCSTVPTYTRTPIYIFCCCAACIFSMASLRCSYKNDRDKMWCMKVQWEEKRGALQYITFVLHNVVHACIDFEIASFRFIYSPLGSGICFAALHAISKSLFICLFIHLFGVLFFFSLFKFKSKLSAFNTYIQWIQHFIKMAWMPGHTVES